jgi:hypothetical protein
LKDALVQYEQDLTAREEKIRVDKKKTDSLFASLKRMISASSNDCLDHIKLSRCLTTENENLSFMNTNLASKIKELQADLTARRTENADQKASSAWGL